MKQFPLSLCLLLTCCMTTVRSVAGINNSHPYPLINWNKGMRMACAADTLAPGSKEEVIKEVPKSRKQEKPLAVVPIAIKPVLVKPKIIIKPIIKIH